MKTSEAIEILEKMKPCSDIIYMSHKDYCALYALAEHAIQIMRESDWQPIETCETHEPVIVCGKPPHNHKMTHYVCEAFKAGRAFMTEQGSLLNQPTHWKPLPKPPEGK